MTARTQGPVPFTFAPLWANPFVAPAVPQKQDSVADVEADALSPHTYALVKSGPEVSSEEVEIAHSLAIEVMVMWGTNVLHVDHLTPPRSYFVGEETDAKCDYFLPTEALGAPRAPIVVARDGGASLVILPRTTGTVDIPGTGTVTLKDLVASGRARPSSEVTGAFELELPTGAKARMQLPDSELVFQVSAVNAGKPVPGAGLSRLEPAHAFFGLSMLLHVGLIASFALFMPSLGADDTDGENRDRIVMMQHMLTASAEHADDARAIEQTANAAADDKSGGTGSRAVGEEGAAGSTVSHETGHKYGVAGVPDNTDPHLARERAIQEAKNFGLLGIIATSPGGDANAPIAAWGRDDSSGIDPKSGDGNMWGDTIGDAFGMGGLGLTGTGEGGGGTAEGIGLGDIGTFGNGHGLGDKDGIGNGHGRLPPTYHPHGIRVREGGDTLVNGRLPSEVIQRIVRQNFGRFRVCYEDGMRQNPGLQGRVAVKFVIDRSGGVSMASDGGSDLPDQNVVSCVVRGFSNLSFPEPANGMVTVVYPIAFTPGQ